MTLISLEEDKKTVSARFRKAENFAFVKNDEINIIKNDYKTEKSKEFFEYFTPLGVKEIYIKALGYKTFVKLQSLGVKVYFVEGVEEYENIKTDNLVEIDEQNAKEKCTLGHK